MIENGSWGVRKSENKTKKKKKEREKEKEKEKMMKTIFAPMPPPDEIKVRVAEKILQGARMAI